MLNRGKTIPKCFECRTRRKTCLPLDRQWPESCFHCKQKGLTCSEGVLAPKRKPRISVSDNNVFQTQAQLPQLVAKPASLIAPYRHIDVGTSRSNNQSPDAVLSLVIAEVIDLAVRELITLADKLDSPLKNDPRFQHPRDSVQDAKHSIDGLRSFSSRLVHYALELNCGGTTSRVQAALNKRNHSRTLMWATESTLKDIQDSFVEWDSTEYPGLEHILQLNLFIEQPQLSMHNLGHFLLCRDLFLDACADLLPRLPIEIPVSVQGSQMFLPSPFMKIPAVESHFHQRGLPDCLGRSYHHILYDIGKWLPASIDVRDDRDTLGRTLLYLACQSSNFKAVTQLLSIGANTGLKAVTGLRPLEIAAVVGNLEICKSIFEQADKERIHSLYDLALEGSDRSPLMWAALNGHVTLVHYFRDKRLSVGRTKDRHGYSAFCLAARQGHSEVVRYFTKRRYQIDSPELKGRNAFWYAANNSQVALMLQLRLAGALIDVADDEGLTPLGKGWPLAGDFSPARCGH